MHFLRALTGTSSPQTPEPAELPKPTWKLKRARPPQTPRTPEVNGNVSSKLDAARQRSSASQTDLPRGTRWGLKLGRARAANSSDAGTLHKASRAAAGRSAQLQAASEARARGELANKREAVKAPQISDDEKSPEEPPRQPWWRAESFKVKEVLRPHLLYQGAFLELAKRGFTAENVEFMNAVSRLNREGPDALPLLDMRKLAGNIYQKFIVNRDVNLSGPSSASARIGYENLDNLGAHEIREMFASAQAGIGDLIKTDMWPRHADQMDKCAVSCRRFLLDAGQLLNLRGTQDVLRAAERIGTDYLENDRLFPLLDKVAIKRLADALTSNGRMSEKKQAAEIRPAFQRAVMEVETALYVRPAGA